MIGLWSRAYLFSTIKHLAQHFAEVLGITNSNE
jgi:hypothetical protein